MNKSVYCPNCGTIAKPSKRWSAASTLNLLWPVALWLLAAALAGHVHANLWNEVLAVTTIFGVPVALLLALLSRGPACSACGWRHVIDADGDHHSVRNQVRRGR